jgi:hypothetical protein
LYEESFKGFNLGCQKLVENEVRIEAMEIGRASLPFLMVRTKVIYSLSAVLVN